MSEDESSIDLSLLSEGLSDEEGDAAPTSTPAAGPSSSYQQAAGQQRKRMRFEGREATQRAGQDSPGTSGAEEQHAEPKQKKHKKVMTPAKVLRLKAANERRGIIYISRIPPHMKPAKLRQLLGAYGEVGRIYCAAEDAAVRRKRKQKGGNTGKNYVEGWVEFEDKSVAKHVAAMLNGQPMGGKRRSAYHYDLWCLKYLPKFKWDHLTEEIAYQKAVKEQRLAAELAAAKRERDFYLSRVDRARAEEAMAQRAAAKAAAAAGGGGGSDAEQQRGAADEGAAAGQAASGGGEGQRPVRRVYGQRRPKADPVQDVGAPELSADVLSLVVRRKQRAGAEQ